MLVVDDDEFQLNSWKRMISRDRVVATASDAARARELVDKQHFDLGIIDLRLGATSGIDLIRHVRAVQPDITIVLCSGYVSVAAAVAGMQAGADSVVFKPITFREILVTLGKTQEPAAITPELHETPTLARAEWEHIQRVLTDCSGNVTQAARRLGIYRSSLQRRLRKYAPRK